MTDTATGSRLPAIRTSTRVTDRAAVRGLTRLPWISGAFCRKFAGSPVCPQVPDERAGDETAMDFRRLLPEIRWQPRLSPDPRRTRGRRDCPRVSRISLLPPACERL